MNAVPCMFLWKLLQPNPIVARERRESCELQVCSAAIMSSFRCGWLVITCGGSIWKEKLGLEMSFSIQN